MNLGVMQGGLSRVTPVSDYSINGLSRVQPQMNALNGYMLSGLMLSGHKANGESFEDFACYVEHCQDYGSQASGEGFANYMMQGRAERKARRDKRKAKGASRGAKKKRRDKIRARREEARTKRLEEGSGFFSKIGEAAKGFADRGFEMADTLGDEFLDDFEMEYLPPGTDTEKGYLLGKPPFEPWTGKWWESSKVPVWQKAAIGVGAALLVDQVALKGKFTNPIIGLNKGKARK